MAKLNLSQDVANERERKQIATHILFPVGMRRYGSLININLSVFS